MRAFNRAIVAVCLLIAAIFAAVNIYFTVASDNSKGRQYRVDIARAVNALENGENITLADYPTITAITQVENDTDLLGGKDDYLIRSVNGRLYRFDYTAERVRSERTAVNISLMAMAAVLITALVVLRMRILKPFTKLSEVPYELSKGNLIVPINEERHRVFGRFTWGLNMLRDNLEQQKQKELALQAEKKKLIISLSHDIKIPLSAIKLYAKALEKGLYDGNRQVEIAMKISEKTEEFEDYVARIVKASNEDFLSLTVEDGEFYLSSLVSQIEAYYDDKLRLLGSKLSVGEYGNCLLNGDLERAVEVLQNIIENAIKYGDGMAISISFDDEEDCRLVTVTNTGCTLPADELPHIFDSFYRGSNASGKGGSGLGLYICRTLMRKMNGDIFVRSADGEINVTVVFQKA